MQTIIKYRNNLTVLLIRMKISWMDWGWDWGVGNLEYRTCGHKIKGDRSHFWIKTSSSWVWHTLMSLICCCNRFLNCLYRILIKSLLLLVSCSALRTTKILHSKSDTPISRTWSAGTATVTKMQNSRKINITIQKHYVQRDDDFFVIFWTLPKQWCWLQGSLH